MNSGGQLSLEYLLLLAAAFAVFALLLPLLNSVFEASVFGLDSVNANRFSNSLQNLVDEMGFQADGSISLIKANPMQTWNFYSVDNNLVIEVEGDNVQKKFEVAFPNKLFFKPVSFSEKKFFSLKKQHGKILLEHN